MDLLMLLMLLDFAPRPSAERLDSAANDDGEGEGAGRTSPIPHPFPLPGGEGTFATEQA
jgi:hypothetical protein